MTPESPADMVSRASVQRCVIEGCDRNVRTYERRSGTGSRGQRLADGKTCWACRMKHAYAGAPDRGPIAPRSNLRRGDYKNPLERRLLSVWRQMVQRCHKSDNRSYRNYGARGITVCEEWRQHFSPFRNYIRDNLGLPGPPWSLDRIDGSRGYEPGNLRWATPQQQTHNRSVTVWITAFGKTQPLAVWAREFGLAHGTIQYRIKKGWSAEAAISTPSQSRRTLRTALEGRVSE